MTAPKDGGPAKASRARRESVTGAALARTLAA